MNQIKEKTSAASRLKGQVAHFNRRSATYPSKQNGRSISKKEGVAVNQKWIEAIGKALKLAEEVLERNSNQLNSETLHRTKSALYGAMENLGTTIERLSYSHRLMRELFSVLNLKLDSREHEQNAGIQILNELRERFQNSSS